MKTKIRLLILLSLFTLLLLPVSVQAAGQHDDKVIFGGSYTLQEGETLNGDIVIFGGTGEIEGGATVTGDVAIFGGRLRSNGTVGGDVVALGGYVEIGPQAVIQGDLTVLGSSVERSEEAVIQGSVVTQSEFPFEFTIPNIRQLSRGSFPRLNLWVNPFVSLSLFFFRVVVWAGLAILVTLFFKDQERTVNQAAFTEPVMSGVVGLLAVILLPVVVIALLITILLSPLSLLAVLLAIAAWVFGLISLGLEVGKRLTKNLKSPIDPALLAGLGTFLVMGILNGFNKLVPCLGFFPKTILGMWMFGAVLLTRFGTQSYSQRDEEKPQERDATQMEDEG